MVQDQCVCRGGENQEEGLSGAGEVGAQEQVGAQSLPRDTARGAHVFLRMEMQTPFG